LGGELAVIAVFLVLLLLQIRESSISLLFVIAQDQRNQQNFQKIFILPLSLASVRFKFLAKMVHRRAQDNLGILATKASENGETFQ